MYVRNEGVLVCQVLHAELHLCSRCLFLVAPAFRIRVGLMFVVVFLLELSQLQGLCD